MHSPVPLPVGWLVRYQVFCPECNQPFHFKARGDGLKCDVCCATVDCPQKDRVYELTLSLNGCAVTAVK